MDGIILINKEKKYTSHDVVAKVKKILKVKVGHTGTLDPNATGILPLLLGNATYCRIKTWSKNRHCRWRR